MMLNRSFPDVLCPKCTYPGGLAIFRDREVPVLSCSLEDCRYLVIGHVENDMAVFPDPHVQAGVYPGDA